MTYIIFLRKIICKLDNTFPKLSSLFSEGIFTTALADDEIITAIRFPKVANGNYQKFYQSAS